ncbi:MAG: D-alanyl-D-alanine carboxypeptidase [Clostridia bacterium]|nr:D-alanyl-D-alanine carboxypeptidase [Clostridia bacterium]
MKRFLYFFLCFVMLISLLPAASRAETTGTTSRDDPFADVTTPHLLLIEAESGAVLYSRAADEKAFPASTTKVMTALLCVEILPDLNKVVTLGWRPVVGFGPSSSLMGLEANEEISLLDMLYGMLMRSGNDAAKALAMECAFEHYGEDIDPAKAVDMFVGLMNERAAQLGMTHTHFTTVDGRHEEDHYTTAEDFGILMREVIKNRMLVQIMGTATYRVQPTNMHPDGFYLENSNKLICKKEADTESYIYDKCFAGKTGETNAAGYCLVSAAQNAETRLILIQFGDDNQTGSSVYRYQVAKRLYEWGFKNYRAFSLSEFGLQTEFELHAENCSPIDEQGGRFTAQAQIDGLSVTGALSNLQKYFDDPSSIRMDLSTEYAIAPIRRGDVVGYVDYYFYEGSAVRAQLVSTRDVASASDSTPEPHETAFISTTPPPGSGKNSNLSIQRSAGADQYFVWIYYDNTLYTMNSTEWHYLYLADDVFRAAAAADTEAKIVLYRRYFDSLSNAYYVPVDYIADGQEYVITVDGRALTTDTREGTLAGAAVDVSGDGIITGGVDDSMIWRFTSHSNGYHITNGSRYLCRSAGSGVLFWVLIVVLVLIALIIIRLIALRRNRRSRRGRRRSPYRSSWR